MTQETADEFAQEWLAAWNAHDLDAILAHYADDVEFTSPFVTRLLGNPAGTLRGREALRDYFARALAAYPELKFEFHQALAGVDTFVLTYRSVLGLEAGEVMRLDSAGRVARVWCHYRKM